MYARLVLARAATVAIRYTAIRRQFGDKDAPKYVHGQILETPTLDYTMVNLIKWLTSGPISAPTYDRAILRFALHRH
jgi:hypothetical protein